MITGCVADWGPRLLPLGHPPLLQDLQWKSTATSLHSIAASLLLPPSLLFVRAAWLGATNCFSIFPYSSLLYDPPSPFLTLPAYFPFLTYVLILCVPSEENFFDEWNNVNFQFQMDFKNSFCVLTITLGSIHKKNKNSEGMREME